MGAGAPMLGDLKKTNFDKPESEGGAALQFELEANNFDLDSRGTYFDDGAHETGVESARFLLSHAGACGVECHAVAAPSPPPPTGYVDDKYAGPGFFENLMSGGKLQREYDERRRSKKGK